MDIIGNSPEKAIIYYTNYRGETSERVIIPISLHFGCNEWHPERQWLLEALDVEKNTQRTFSMSTIHHWRKAVQGTK